MKEKASVREGGPRNGPAEREQRENKGIELQLPNQQV